MANGMEQAQLEFQVMMKTLNEQIKKLTDDYMKDHPHIEEYVYSIAVTIPEVKSKGYVMGGAFSEGTGLAHLALSHRSGTTAVLGEETPTANRE